MALNFTTHSGGNLDMMDAKDPQAVHSEAVSNSDIDDAEKAGRASITVGNHKENLNDLDDPDAGKTAEERAAIVSDATHFCELIHED